MLMVRFEENNGELIRKLNFKRTNQHKNSQCIIELFPPTLRSM